MYLKQACYGDNVTSWVSEYLILRDDCKECIDEFWSSNELNPTKDFYPGPEGLPHCWICGWASKNNKDLRYLNTHLTRGRHHWDKQSENRTHASAKIDVLLQKRLQQQQDKSHVYWYEKEVANCWLFKYLGSYFQPDGDHLPDVKIRIARARTRAGKPRHIWNTDHLSLTLKIRLYKSAVCSILKYGAEAWLLDERTCKALTSSNAAMLTSISGKTHREEACTSTTTSNILAWIRSRRLQWCGHILRLQKVKRQNSSPSHRLIHQALHHIYNNKQVGDILIDAPPTDS